MTIVFDPHMNKAGNKVPNEAPRVFGTTATRRLLFPLHAPFFSENVTVRQGATVLKEFSDYVVGFTYAAAMLRTRRRVHGAIWIINDKLPGPFKIDYHSLGMAEVGTPAITSYLASTTHVPSEDYWDELVNDLYIPPVDVIYDRKNWRGEKELMDALHQLAVAMANRPADTATPSGAAMQKQYYEAIKSLHENSPAIAHVKQKGVNVHHDTPRAHGAMPLNATAADATQLNSRNFDQLASEINAALPNSGSLVNKILGDGGASTITGSFVMKPGVSFIGADTSAKDNSFLTLDPNMFMTAVKMGNMSITAPGGMRWRSGVNVLELFPDARGLKWNGKELLTPSTVGPYLPGGSANSGVVYYGQSSPTVDITGSGVLGAPFVCTWKPQDPAVLSALAMRQLTDDFGASVSLAASTKLLQKLANSFTGKLTRNEATLNGNPLGSAVVLTKASISLPNVEDVSDANMPVSTLQATEFDKYALSGHNHLYGYFGIGAATTSVAGLIQFGGLVNDVTKALSGEHAVGLIERVDTLQSAAGGGSSGLYVNITRVGDPEQKPIVVTPSNWLFTLPAINYYVKKSYPTPAKTFNLAELYPAKYKDMDGFIYLDIQAEVGTYVVSDVELPETATRTKVVTVNSGTVGVDAFAIPQFTAIKGNNSLAAHSGLFGSTHVNNIFEESFLIKNTDLAGIASLSELKRLVRSHGSITSENHHRDWYLTDAYNLPLPITGVELLPTGYKILPGSLQGHNNFRLLRNRGVKQRGTSEATTSKGYRVTVESGTDTVVEIPFVTFADSSGKWNRISVLVAAGNAFIDAVSGNPVIMAIGYNYGTDKQTIVPINASPEISAGFPWSPATYLDIQAFGSISTNDSTATIHIGIPGRFPSTFVLKLYTSSVTLQYEGVITSTTLPGTGLGVSMAELTSDAIGGLFQAPTTIHVVDFDYTLPSNPGANGNVLSAIALADYTNMLDRCMVYDETIPDAELSLTFVQHKTILASKIAKPGLGGQYQFVDPDKMIVTIDTTNKRRQAVYIRD